MRLCILNEKLEGKVIANEIYNDNGVMFLNKGNTLTLKIIKRLQDMGINTVYVNDDLSDNELILQEVLDTRIKLKIIKDLREIFSEIKSKSIVNYEKSYEIINTIVQNMNLSENAIICSNLIKNDELFKLSIHSVDVALLSIMIGVNKKYELKKLINLGLAALLHDIGKLIGSDENHAEIGFNLLKQNSMFKPTTFTSVYQHHEFEDGTGPLKTMGEKIFEFAKIINISDLYINTISQKSILPHEAIEKISALCPKKLSLEIYKDFVKSIYCYPNGLRVKLNNGLEGIVIGQNKNLTTRPIIKALENEDFRYINLEKELTVFIDKVIL